MIYAKYTGILETLLLLYEFEIKLRILYVSLNMLMNTFYFATDS